MDIAILSPIIVMAAALGFILLERRLPYDPSQSLWRDGFWNDLAMYTVIQSYILGYVIFGIASILDETTGMSKQGLLSGWPVAGQVILSLFVHDLYIYWFHRWQHNNKYLWRIHEAHHSTREVDWLSGSRSHSLEILINQSVEFVPLVLLGAAPIAIASKGMIDAVWGMWIHSNINARTGLIGFIINGPQMHRWHHALDDEAHNRNFATKFAFWDYLFGTAYLPEARKPRGYGLGDLDFPRNYLRQHLFAFRRFERS
jgi:sterol desaturase/sphingolipid hydroxylase (fatty acid hydroxylase superfamily)